MIKWRFNAPSAFHIGGAWSAKYWSPTPNLFFVGVLQWFQKATRYFSHILEEVHSRLLAGHLNKKKWYDRVVPLRDGDDSISPTRASLATGK